MTQPYDAFTTLWSSVDFIGTGLTLALIVLIIISARAFIKDEKQWPLYTSTILIFFSLVITNMYFSTMLFAAGLIALIITYNETIRQLIGTDIFQISLTSVMLYTTLSILLVVITAAQGSVQDENALEGTLAGYENWMSDLGGEYSIDPCGEGDTTACTGIRKEQGFINGVIYDIFSSWLAIGRYLGKAVTFIGKALFVPSILITRVGQYITNPIIRGFMLILLVGWNLGILYNIIKFILNKRGMSDG